MLGDRLRQYRPRPRPCYDALPNSRIASPGAMMANFGHTIREAYPSCEVTANTRSNVMTRNLTPNATSLNEVSGA